jgi:hypothetical protein
MNHSGFFRMTFFRLVTCLTFLASTAAAEVEPCVTGTWQADLGELAILMATQMQGSATPVSGRVTMQITPVGGVRITVDSMTISVKVPNAPEMEVSVSGHSAGSMTASGNVWAANTTDYNLIGSADVLGSRMEIPFSSTTGMFGSGDGTYACSSDTLSFETRTTPAKIPPNWKRLG